MQSRNLAYFERIFGPNHVDTMISRNSLATAYHDAGRIDEAIALHHRNLAARERIPGPEHPATLVSRRYLYDAHKQLGLGQWLRTFVVVASAFHGPQ